MCAVRRVEAPLPDNVATQTQALKGTVARRATLEASCQTILQNHPLNLWLPHSIKRAVKKVKALVLNDATAQTRALRRTVTQRSTLEASCPLPTKHGEVRRRKIVEAPTGQVHWHRTLRMGR
jgi:hypothetical protein